jgi:hypothetical protein
MMDLKNLPVFSWILGKHIDFMRIRYWWFGATTILTVLGATMFLIRGTLGLNIDFTGGTAITYELNDLMTISDVRNKLDEKEWRTKLQVTKAAQIDPDGYLWEITYAGETKPRRIALPNADKNEQDIIARASQLPDQSVEQIFMASGDYSKGDKSRIITVRTPEKAAELVQLVVNRLLDTDLRRIYLINPTISADNREIKLEFHDSDKPDSELVFASPAQVTMLLQREFKAAAQQLATEGKEKQAAELERFAQLISVTKSEDAKENEGLFDKMVVRLPESADASKTPE